MDVSRCCMSRGARIVFCRYTSIKLPSTKWFGRRIEGQSGFSFHLSRCHLVAQSARQSCSLRVGIPGYRWSAVLHFCTTIKYRTKKQSGEKCVYRHYVMLCCIILYAERLTAASELYRHGFPVLFTSEPIRFFTFLVFLFFHFLVVGCVR